MANIDEKINELKIEIADYIINKLKEPTADKDMEIVPQLVHEFVELVNKCV